MELRRLRPAATGPALDAEPHAYAEWFAKELREVGFSASVRDMPGRAIAVGHDRRSQGPTVLFCGHYEVPPDSLRRGNRRDGTAPSSTADPLRRWANDQSTQLLAFIEACRAWKAVAGQLPAPISVLVEGEDRSGSAGLVPFMRMYADELRADIGLAPAARTRRCSVPTTAGMLYGVCCEEFTISIDGDEPDGQGRGIATDPMLILAGILGDLHDPSGRVAIPGFYNGIDAPLRAPCDQRSSASGKAGDPPPRAQDHAAPEGRRDKRHVEAMPVWPTCEIDCVSSRRRAGGRRHEICPPAFARLSLYLVCYQDPELVCQALRDFARARVPLSARIEFNSVASAVPVRFLASHPAFRKAQDALSIEWERQAVFACCDGAPGIHALVEALGMEAIVTSFPERQDASGILRETVQLASYRSRIRSWARILDALGQ